MRLAILVLPIAAIACAAPSPEQRAAQAAHTAESFAQLTEGRGGRFTTDPDNPERLVYHPSGREPKIVAGSRRGTRPTRCRDPRARARRRRVRAGHGRAPARPP